MAETCTDDRWLWTDMVDDLRKAGLEEVDIDPSTISEDYHTVGGRTKDGIYFVVTWMKDRFLLVSMTKKSQAITDAFSKVVEYKPFAEYISVKGLYTVEWDRTDPKGRFKKLQDKGEKNLKRI